MKVQVNQKHIETGQCKVAQRCMIAAAIKDVDPEISYVAVRTNCITITKRRKEGGGIRQHWAVPLKVAKAIISFDEGQPVKPFSFAAKLIDEIHLTPIKPDQARKNNTRTKKRRAKLAKAGIQPPAYGQRGRIAGV